MREVKFRHCALQHFFAAALFFVASHTHPIHSHARFPPFPPIPSLTSRTYQRGGEFVKWRRRRRTFAPLSIRLFSAPFSRVGNERSRKTITEWLQLPFFPTLSLKVGQQFPSSRSNGAPNFPCDFANILSSTLYSTDLSEDGFPSFPLLSNWVWENFSFSSLLLLFLCVLVSRFRLLFCGKLKAPFSFSTAQHTS